MNSKIKANEAYVKHHQEIEDIGRSNVCPITILEQQGGQAFLFRKIQTWLRLQNQKLDYRLLYCDIAVCCVYILFIFSALTFNSVVLSQDWLSAIIVIVLLAGCILFIGIHLVPYKKSDTIAPKPVAETWASYRQIISKLPAALKAYTCTFILLLLMFGYNELYPIQMLSAFLLLSTAILFGTGVYLLSKALNAKYITKVYVTETARFVRNNHI
ncbi:hypothetical protein FPZ43_11740 [Mucilaginibacter pallidiroseus]|uniref:Uncharacterized protein n=1 Tax=Mucilaginibacter pallidiroseus TaxID=2599295 RepID=A0A563UC80_9SPHI|nr:hypothetical protein [Mucilaginibacter pallidiroseus]TWR28930.1 hypothetical protein FPZ43_11740 [Mucilaginibacter pallidiroseus]